MKRIESKVLALEQSRVEPPPEPEPEDLEALALWHAQQHDFTKAARVAGISEDEALERWAEETGYLALQGVVAKQRQDCLAYCQAHNTGRLPREAIGEPEPQLPQELRLVPPKLQQDKRRWRDLEKRKRRYGSTGL